MTPEQQIPLFVPRGLTRRDRKNLATAVKLERLARAGCLQLHYCKATRGLVGIYDARAARLDTDGGRYVTVCEAHGCVCNHASPTIARRHLSRPDGWCEECFQLLGRDQHAPGAF